MKTKPADIILTHSRSWLGKAILWILRFFQHDNVNFSHILMVCHDNVGIEAGKSVLYVNLDEKLRSVQNYKVIRKKNLTEKQRLRVVKKAKKCLGQKYSVFRLCLQLCDQIFHTNWFTRRVKYRRHICSGLVAWAYYATYKIKFNDINWRSCEPDDIDDESLNNPDLWEIIDNG